MTEYFPRQARDSVRSRTQALSRPDWDLCIFSGANCSSICTVFATVRWPATEQESPEVQKIGREIGNFYFLHSLLQFFPCFPIFCLFLFQFSGLRGFPILQLADAIATLLSSFNQDWGTFDAQRLHTDRPLTESISLASAAWKLQEQMRSTILPRKSLIVKVFPLSGKSKQGLTNGGLSPRYSVKNRAKILPGKSGLFWPDWSLFRGYRGLVGADRDRFLCTSQPRGQQKFPRKGFFAPSRHLLG